MIAALYVETNGVYYGLPDVDPWDEARDARLYDGPWPVVAHPPCQRWCKIARLVESIYGYPVGDDGGTFVAALSSVRQFGGVLEHPAGSLAWTRFGLPTPIPGGWSQSFDDPGYVTEVSQSAYGHAARKRTWLYYVGPPPTVPIRWSDPRGAAQVSSFRSTRRHASGTWNERHLDHGRSSYTPPAFRDVLLSLARSAAPRSGRAPSPCE